VASEASDSRRPGNRGKSGTTTATLAPSKRRTGVPLLFTASAMGFHS